MVTTVQELHYEALKHLRCYGFQFFSNEPYQDCIVWTLPLLKVGGSKF